MVALNVLYLKNEKIYASYVSKHNWNRKKQVIILMILNREKSRYISVKIIYIIKRNNVNTWGWFCYLSSLHLFKAKNKLESNYNVVMPSEVYSIL